MKINNTTTALVVTDPQNDFLSEDGAAWGLVGDSVRENNTIANLETLLTAARDGGYRTFVSPHYYYPADKQWQFGGTLERKMHEIGMFSRSGPLDLSGFEGSGADWLERLKPLLSDSNTARTRSTAPRTMTWCCSCANTGSERSSWPECRRTCASNRTCAIWSSRDSKCSSSRTRPRPHAIRSLVTGTKPP